MPAQCRTSSGLRGSAPIVDLTAEGCSILPVNLALHVGHRVWIKPDNFQSLPATVRWVRGKFAGLEFDQPLYGPVAEHLQATFQGTST